MYYRGDQQAFITVTGLDPACFHELLTVFKPLFDLNSPYSCDDGYIRRIRQTEKCGHPRKITAHACLGLVLYWTRTTAFYWEMAGYFGMVTSCCDLWLRFRKRLLLHILSQRTDAQVRMPAEQKLEEYKKVVAARHPALKHTCFVADGMKVLIGRSGLFFTQERFYNGWKGDHFITNLFVFCPDGTICVALINAPGNCHDSELASYGSRSIWHEKYGVQCVMDSAFCTCNRQSCIKSVPRDRVTQVASSSEEIAVLDQALSLRQSAEWGMRALQGSMPRLKARWVYEERDERRVSLLMMVLLYNYQANNMDLNQIRSVYWNSAVMESNEESDGGT